MFVYVNSNVKATILKNRRFEHCTLILGLKNMGIFFFDKHSLNYYLGKIGLRVTDRSK